MGTFSCPGPLSRGRNIRAAGPAEHQEALLAAAWSRVRPGLAGVLALFLALGWLGGGWLGAGRAAAQEGEGQGDRAEIQAGIPEDAATDSATDSAMDEVPDSATDAALDAAILAAAYPGAVRGLALDPGGGTVVVLSSGQRLAYDTGNKTPAQALDHPDVRDMLEQAYPLGPRGLDPAPGFDPGRRRVNALFLALYGHDEKAVAARLAPVSFLGRMVLFHTGHGAGQALNRVAERLNPRLREHPEWRAALFPLAGTFSWRTIAGTDRLSMHSLAVALDLRADLPYWRTYRGLDLAARRRAIPAEVVEAFEAEGFIWGGKWAAFDLMHFEYRPELVLKSRILAGLAPAPPLVPVLDPGPDPASGAGPGRVPAP